MTTSVRKLTSLIVLGVVGNSVLYLVPLLIGAMVTDRGFTETQAGFLASGDIGGFAASTLLTALLLDRFSLRHIALAGALIMVLANIVTTGVHSLAPFAVIRFVSGFGCGFLVAVSSVALGREENADRNFGLFYAASLLFATAAFWALPPVIAVLKLNSVYWLFVLLAIGTIPFAKAIPDSTAFVSHSGTPLRQRRWHLAATMLAAIVVFLAQQGALWAYLERLGSRASLSNVFIGFALGCATLTGFAGASLVAWTGNRLDRRLPIIVTTLIEIFALIALMGRPSPIAFLAASAVLALCWNVVNPIQLGILADVDPAGKALALSATATGAGMALGPSIGAVTLSPDGYNGLLIAVGALTVLSVGLMMVTLRTRILHATPTVT